MYLSTILLLLLNSAVAEGNAMASYKLGICSLWGFNTVPINQKDAVKVNLNTTASYSEDMHLSTGVANSI
jgi:hypothetical protein